MVPISLHDHEHDQGDCPLCGRATDADDFATTSFLPVGHPLARYTGKPIHWNCYARWAFQTHFAQAHFKYWTKRPVRRQVPLVYRGSDVLVHWDRRDDQVSVLLRESGSQITLPLAGWDDFVTFDWRNQTRHLLETRALDSVIEKLAWIRDPSAVVVEH